jgi:hypothetical protein
MAPNPLILAVTVGDDKVVSHFAATDTRLPRGFRRLNTS